MTSIPWTDLRNAPSNLRLAGRDHRAAGLPLADLALYTTWKPGLGEPDDGPLLLSLTQYAPHHLRDLIAIWSAADELGDELVQIDGAVGVLTYVEPGRRRLGSLSVWADPTGLGRFVRLPRHVEIMRQFKPRGLPLRSASWEAPTLHVGQAMDHGRRLLNSSNARRVPSRRAVGSAAADVQRAAGRTTPASARLPTALAEPGCLLADQATSQAAPDATVWHAMPDQRIRGWSDRSPPALHVPPQRTPHGNGYEVPARNGCNRVARHSREEGVDLSE